MIVKTEIAVIGAGSFGSWTALELARRGHDVVLADQHGPANSRASSGGETRIIRASYGSAAHYSEMAWESLRAWTDLDPSLFVPSGALFTARPGNAHLEASAKVLRRLKIPAAQLSEGALRRRFPQIRFPEGSVGLLEPESGVLLARRGVQLAARKAIEMGVRYLQMEVRPETVRKQISADIYLYACGPWLPRLFPRELGSRIWPTRQEVFFFGTRPGGASFLPGAMPAWVDFDATVYALPDIENRGFKIAVDRHGPAFDPDLGARVVSPSAIRRMRGHVETYFPELAEAPLVETRVCQYENTSNGDFLIDWLEPGRLAVAGGGSGHGFKHGPAVGRIAADLLEGRLVLPQFSLASKDTRKRRAIY